MILVTGGAGYVGSHFVAEYLADNPANTIVVIDNLSKGHIESLPKSSRLHLLVGEIDDSQLVEEAIKSHAVDAVVHFAAKIEVGESEKDPFGYFENNVFQSVSLFRAMERCSVRKIVFSSTCAVYGEPEYLPIDEKHRVKPASIYGTTKLLVEQVLHSFTQTLGWSSVSLRYFNAAGASENGQMGESHDPESHLIPNVLKVAMGKADFVTIHGTDYQTKDGTCVRDYVHVNDLASAHINALKLLKEVNTARALTINLGCAKGFTVSEVLSACEEVTGREIPRRDAPRRQGDSPSLLAEISEAMKILDWRPTYDLKRIIETAWKWEQNRRY